MTKYKIVFLDIDGTILRPDDTIEDSTKNAISQLQSKGIEVVLATGRPLHEIHHIGEVLNITSFIAYNGAYAIHRGNEIYKSTMDPQFIDQFLQSVAYNEHDAVLLTNHNNLFTSLDSEIVKKFIKTIHLTQNELINPDDLEGVLGITLLTDKENAPLHYEDFAEVHFSQVNVQGVDRCYDVIRDNVNKGVAVKAFLEKINYPIESSIAFGDGMNDKEMLSFVGEGIAMGNANPDLFAYAKHKTTDVKNSGVYNGLKALGLVN